MKKILSASFSLMLAVALLALPLFSYGEAQKDNPDIHVPLITVAPSALTNEKMTEVDFPELAYNQMLVYNATLWGGCFNWLTYEEALSYYPTLPLPEIFKGCKMEGCRIIIYDLKARQDSVLGEAYTVEALPKNIMEIEAKYSDGKTTYHIQYNPIENVDTSFITKPITDEGSLMIDANSNMITGIFLARLECTMRVHKGGTAEKALWEIQDGFFVHHSKGSEITEENAADYLSDPDVTGLFDSLIAFTKD